MKLKRLIILPIIFAVLFILLSVNLNNTIVTNTDYQTSKFFGAQPYTGITQLAYLIGIAFDTIPMIIVCLLVSFLLFIKSKQREGIALAIISLLGAALIYLLKEIIQRARPFFQFVEETGFSFPSGHSTIAMILFGFILFLSLIHLKKNSQKIVAAIISVLIIAIIGLSRLYLNVHWASDVVGGYLLGAFLVSIAIIFLKTSDSKF